MKTLRQVALLIVADVFSGELDGCRSSSAVQRQRLLPGKLRAPTWPMWRATRLCGPRASRPHPTLPVSLASCTFPAVFLALRTLRTT